MIDKDVNLVLYGTSLSVVLGKAAVTSDSVPVCSFPACLSALLLTSGELLLACLLLISPACSSAQLLSCLLSVGVPWVESDARLSVGLVVN